MSNQGLKMNGEVDDQKEEPSVKGLLVSFSESTTMHGLSKIGSSDKRPLTRLIWILFVLFFLGLACYNVTLVLMNYLSYPVSTVVTVRYEDHQQFPAITICNMNQLRLSQFNKNKKLRALKEEVVVRWIDPELLSSTTMEPPSGRSSSPSSASTNQPRKPLSRSRRSPDFASDLGIVKATVEDRVRDMLGALSGGASVTLPTLLTNGHVDTRSSHTMWSSSNVNNDRSAFPSDFSGLNDRNDVTTGTTENSLSVGRLSDPTTPPTTPSANTTNNWWSWDDDDDADDKSSPSTATVTTPSLPPRSSAPTSTTEEYDYGDYFWADYEDKSDHLGQIEKDEETKASIRTFMETVSTRERLQFGHQMVRMLLDCRYQTKEKCNHKNFTKFYNHYFGNCYTFNKDIMVESVSKPGPLYGLSLLLNVESEEYMKQSDTVGFKVVIHSQSSMPFPEDEGIVISPGFATNIAIKKQDVKRSPPPFENCKRYSDEENLKVNMYAMPPYKVHYSDKACQRTCYQRNVVLLCHCCDADYPCLEDSQAIPAKNVSFCKSNAEIRCVKKIHNDLESDELGCKDECIPNCAETTYSGEVSMGVWPSEPHLQTLKKRSLDDLLSSDRVDDTNLAFYRKNIAKLNIYFKQLNYEKIETVPAYNWYRLLSDLGGQLGLWVGLSLLTVIEFAELFCLVVAHFFKKAHQTGHNIIRNAKGNAATPV